MLSGGTIMKRNLVSLLSVLMIVVSMSAANLLAGVTTSYGTSSLQYIGKVTNYKSYSQTVYGKLYPAATSPAAKLQIRDATGVAILKQDTYPAYPQNPNNLTCYVGPNGDARTFYVKPATSGDYVWGTAEYGML